MKVILLTDVKKQGKKGDVIEVSDGYGKNYIIKNKLGILADKEGLRKLNIEKRKKEEIDNENKKEALKIKKELEKLKLVFKVKTGIQDKVFGTVSVKQIAKELEKYNIDKKKIITDIPLDHLGVYDIKVELYKDIIAMVKVELQKESR